MIKLIREGSHNHPWVLKIIMIVIAVTFTIGMGWWGFHGGQPNVVASVGPYSISMDEYRRAYNNAYRFYRDQLKQKDVDKENLKHLVLDNLLEAKTWNVVADKLGIEVSPEALRDAIVAQKDFQQDGKFDPQYYQRLLSANRLTPHQYESQRMVELLVTKAKLLVQESTALTPAELTEVKSLAARQAKEGEAPDPSMVERIRLQFLLQKKQRALQAFQAAMRTVTPVETHDELL